jgi:hypothetical protein
MGDWDSTPRIAFLSPERGSGKSRALEVIELLVPRPVYAVNVSPSYLFRKDTRHLVDLRPSPGRLDSAERDQSAVELGEQLVVVVQRQRDSGI